MTPITLAVSISMERQRKTNRYAWFFSLSSSSSSFANYDKWNDDEPNDQVAFQVMHIGSSFKQSQAITHTFKIILGILSLCISSCEPVTYLIHIRRKKKNKLTKKEKKDLKKYWKKEGKKHNQSDTHAHSLISTKIWCFHTRDRR